MDCEGTYFSEEKNPMIRLTVEVISCILTEADMARG